MSKRLSPEETRKKAEQMAAKARRMFVQTMMDVTAPIARATMQRLKTVEREHPAVYSRRARSSVVCGVPR